MKNLMKLVVMLVLLTMSSVSYAKDNFKMTGKIDGVKNDTLCIEYTVDQPEKHTYCHKVVVKNGMFSFSDKLREAEYAEVFLKSDPKASHFVYLVPDEEAVFCGRLNAREAHWSGSHFYQQYEEVANLQRPFEVEYAANKSLPDSIRRSKNQDVSNRKEAACMKYIEDHSDEDVAATLMLLMNYDQILPAMKKLSPKVRNGRMKADLDATERFISFAMHEIAARNAVKDDTVKIGDPLPELGLKDMKGNVLEMKSLRGKYVVLDFWGSWCVWCIKGFPKLKEYYTKYKDRLEVVGIACRDTQEKWTAAMKKHAIPWLNVISEDGITEQRFRIEGYPFKVVISPDGTILKTFLGEGEEFYQYLDENLSK